MGLNRALDISVSGVSAERLVMELIASNIANINTTRTAFGGPYRRKVAVIGEKSASFDSYLTAAEQKIGGGVEVLDILEDQTPYQKIYKPGHPDADAEGFVNLPNVDLAEETVDMMYASRLYEANITAFNATKKMMQDALQIQ